MNNVLVTIAPATDAFTNTYCPARKAVSAMTNSVRFPSVALSRPPTASPVLAATDSVAWLKGGSEPIDLLYLDSLDADEARCAEHGLAEIQAAYPRLRSSSLVACDDTVYRANAFHGKGAYVVPWLIERGWRILFSGHQTILTL